MEEVLQGLVPGVFSMDQDTTPQMARVRCLTSMARDFRDDEEQKMGETSDEEDAPETEERGDEEDSEEIPLAEIARR